MKKSQHFLTLSQQPDRPCELVGVRVGVDVGGNGVIGVSHDFLEVFGASAGLDHHARKGVPRGMERPLRDSQPLQQRIILPFAKVVIAFLPALRVAYKVLAGEFHQRADVGEDGQGDRDHPVPPGLRLLAADHVRRLPVEVHIGLADAEKLIDSESRVNQDHYYPRCRVRRGGCRDGVALLRGEDFR